MWTAFGGMVRGKQGRIWLRHFDGSQRFFRNHADVKKVQDKGQSLARKHRPAGRVEDGKNEENRIFIKLFSECDCHWIEDKVTISVTEIPDFPTVEGFLLSQICHCAEKLITF